MDKESKGAAGMPWAQGIILALLLGVGTLFIADVPYISNRYLDQTARGDQRFADQDIDARLWQDPLGVVQRAREAAKGRGGQAPVAAASAASAASGVAPMHSLERLRDEIAAATVRDARIPPLVVAVMLRGGPYPESVEQRRRARYAVLAGLNEMGYAPTDSEHLGWIAPPNIGEEGAQLPEAIPYEWLDIVPSRSESGWPRGVRLNHVLVLWLDDRAFMEQPVARMNALAEALTPEGIENVPVSPWRIIGPIRSDALLAMKVESAKGASAPGYRRLHYYAAMPTVSDETILQESKRDPGQPSYLLSQRFRDQIGIAFTRTIANDGQLVRALVDELKLRGLRAKTLPAALASDAASSNARGGAEYGDVCRHPGERLADEPSHIAVVSEWDTLYGRSLRQQFRADKGIEGFCVDRFAYMRGLDGMRPDELASDSGSGKADSGDAKDKDRRKDGTFIERAEGQSQFDYLRRLSKQMHERDDALRLRTGGRGLQAIGVLGNDVHDKLLVLQALQPEFPTAIFFTTDLDARYLHPREQAWARNLIVASSFGLRLDDRLQAGTPPFRDAYQTSQFFATRLLVDDAKRSLSTQPPHPFVTKCPHEATAAWRQEDLNVWLGRPRIFEIGRTRAFDFSGRRAGEPSPPLSREPVDTCGPSALQAQAQAKALAQAHPEAQTEAIERDKECRDEKWLNCADIQPTGSQKEPVLDLAARWLICLLVLLSWVPVFVSYHGGFGKLFACLRFKGLSREQGRRRAGMLALTALLQFAILPGALALAWPEITDLMTEQGKPLDFTEGISLWPTEIIRLFAFLLGGYLLLRAWRGLENNQERINLTFFFKATRGHVEAGQEYAERGQRLPTRIANIFRWNAVEPAGRVAMEPTGLTLQVEEIWKRHVVQNRLGARMTRTVAYVALMLLLTWAIVLAFHELDHVPHRGQLSLVVHKALHVLVFLMLYVVVFFVADAALLCVSFLRHLRESICLWPKDTIAHFRRELAFGDDNLIGRWISLQFAAARTQEINQLVFYPFILLSLVLLSRSPAFDDWQMPTSGKVLAALGALVAIGCAVLLRQAAERSRRKALIEIDKALMRANARGAGAAAGEGAGAGETPDGGKGYPPPTPRQLELLRNDVVGLTRGAFAPYSQQPVLKALLLPFATIGGSTLLEYLSLANL